jgi:hypothetical protein
MAAPVLQPTAVGYMVGFITAEAITSLTRDSQDNSSFADIEEIRDENNAAVAILVSNPGLIKRFEAIMLSAYTPPVKGSVVTVNSVKFMVYNVSIKYSRTWTRVSLELQKPDSITFT